MKIFLTSTFIYSLSAALLYFSFVENLIWTQNLTFFYFNIGEVLSAGLFLLVGLIYVANQDAAKDVIILIIKKRNWFSKYFGISFNILTIGIFAAQAWYFTALVLTIFLVFRMIMKECFKVWAKENDWDESK